MLIKSPTSNVGGGFRILERDPEKDQYAEAKEQPHHNVYIPEFYIGKYLVSNMQYQLFIDATGYFPRPEHLQEKYNDAHPVNNVTWIDAIAYCNWLEKTTGKSYRLPTEAEWEKASRGTDGRIYPWGNEWDDRRGIKTESYISVMTPVVQYSLQGDSPYGVVYIVWRFWEWCSSLYKSYPYNADDRREDLELWGVRMLRGGGFVYNQKDACCASRGWAIPDNRASDLGFRVALYPSTSDV